MQHSTHLSRLLHVRLVLARVALLQRLELARVALLGRRQLLRQAAQLLLGGGLRRWEGWVAGRPALGWHDLTWCWAGCVPERIRSTCARPRGPHLCGARLLLQLPQLLRRLLRLLSLGCQLRLQLLLLGGGRRGGAEGRVRLGGWGRAEGRGTHSRWPSRPVQRRQALPQPHNGLGHRRQVPVLGLQRRGVRRGHLLQLARLGLQRLLGLRLPGGG